eukprot:3598442-Pleurochrysis_carterae.AAC.1
MRRWANRWETNSSGKDVIYSDVVDGAFFRDHPQPGEKMLGKEAAPDSTLHVGLIIYYDELEAVNPLGACTGVHEMG